MKIFSINRYPLIEYPRFKNNQMKARTCQLTVSILLANIHKFEHHFLLKHVVSVCLYTHTDMFLLPYHTTTEYYK